MKKSIVFILISFWLLIGGRVQAAGVFSEAKSYLEGGEKFYKVEFFLDTDGQSLNALEGEMLFADQDLDLEKIENGSSIVNFWVEEPEKAGGGKIVFSGGMPGGYRGSRGFLFAAIFSQKDRSSTAPTEITFQNFEAYLNDGKGTAETIVDTKNALELEKIGLSDVPEDAKAPEIFAPYVTQDPDLEGGKWVLLFNAQDKGGGIDHYEVFESEEKYDPEEMISSSTGWIKTESGEAYVLRDQDLESYVYVRAVDKSGNFRIAAVVPADGRETGDFDYVVLSGIIILSVIGAVVALELLVFRKKESNLHS